MNTNPLVIVSLRHSDSIADLKQTIEYYKAIGARQFQFVTNQAFDLTGLSSEHPRLRLSVFESNAEDAHLRAQACLTSLEVGTWVIVTRTHQFFHFALSELLGFEGLVEYLELQHSSALLCVKLLAKIEDSRPFNLARLTGLSSHEESTELEVYTEVYVEPSENYPYVKFVGSGEPYKDQVSLTAIPLFKTQEGISLDANFLPLSQLILSDIIGAVVQTEAQHSSHGGETCSTVSGTQSLIEMGFITLTKPYIDWCFDCAGRGLIAPNAHAIDTIQTFKKASFIDGRREYTSYSDLLRFWDTWISRL